MHTDIAKNPKQGQRFQLIGRVFRQGVMRLFDGYFVTPCSFRTTSPHFRWSGFVAVFCDRQEEANGNGKAGL